MRAIILLAAMLAVPGAAAEQQQFDLICKGSGAEVRYRVDLARNEACSDGCDRVWKMGETTTGELKLVDKVPAYRGDLEERSTVSRSTGKWRYFLDFHGVIARDGECQAAPFTGFPKPLF